jgi:MFS family permease
MTLATAFASFGMGGINFHVVPILLNAGYKPGLASAAFGSSWILSGVGSLIAGTVATKYGAGRVFAVSLLIGAVGTCLLMFVANANIGGLSLWLFVVFWGLTANALNQFVPVIFMEEFGPEHLAGLVGIQSALMGLVSSFAPTATGALYDLFAGYQAAIIASTITTLLGCVLVFACRRLACLSAAPRPARRA